MSTWIDFCRWLICASCFFACNRIAFVVCMLHIMQSFEFIYFCVEFFCFKLNISFYKIHSLWNSIQRTFDKMHSLWNPLHLDYYKMHWLWNHYILLTVKCTHYETHYSLLTTQCTHNEIHNILRITKYTSYEIHYILLTTKCTHYEIHCIPFTTKSTHHVYAITFTPLTLVWSKNFKSIERLSRALRALTPSNLWSDALRWNGFPGSLLAVCSNRKQFLPNINI